MKDIKNAKSHLQQHQTYPATRQELIETCNKLSDFSQKDKEWFESNLPEGTYNSAEEVMMAIGWNDKTAKMYA
jgi:hypothetical protein